MSVRMRAVSIADSICWPAERLTAVGSAAARADARIDGTKTARLAPVRWDVPEVLCCPLIMVVSRVGTTLPNWCENVGVVGVIHP